MAAAVQSVLLVGTAAWLFYNTWLAVAALLPVGIWYWHEWREECCKRKEQLFREQFQNGIQILSSLLKAGYSVENAIRETEKDLRPLYREGSRIRTEFERMVRELDMNLTAEQVLTSFSKRVNQEDVNNFVTVFAAAKRTGGDSISILKETVRIIGGKIETEREIQTVLADKTIGISCDVCDSSWDDRLYAHGIPGVSKCIVWKHSGSIIDDGMYGRISVCLPAWKSDHKN